MADAKKKAGGADHEEEVWIAISAFEQILEAMPEDRTSLEALHQAYEQIGDHTKSREYLIRLGRVLAKEGDMEAAQKAAKTLAPFVKDDPAARELYDLISTSVASGTGAEPIPSGMTPPPPESETRDNQPFDIAEELAFAWSLLESNLLTQEEYASVIQDLTEMSTADTESTLSVLHALEFRTFRNLDKVMCEVSREHAAPIITLGNFDLPRAAMDALPLTFMIRKGALVFDYIGKDALVVVMNPHDAQLRKSIQGTLNRRCHFFMTLPSEFDKAIIRVREAKNLSRPPAESGAGGRKK